MDIQHLRFQGDNKHTKSLFIVDGEFKCFLLEDAFKSEKVYGETRIPPGTYKLELRTEGVMNKKYSSKFPNIHKGMLWIKDIPNFKYVYYHIGNYISDTYGCPLTGLSANAKEPKILSSKNAYTSIYPTISEAILNGEEVTITIKNLDECYSMQ